MHSSLCFRACFSVWLKDWKGLDLLPYFFSTFVQEPIMTIRGPHYSYILTSFLSIYQSSNFFLRPESSAIPHYSWRAQDLAVCNSKVSTIHIKIFIFHSIFQSDSSMALATILILLLNSCKYNEICLLNHCLSKFLHICIPAALFEHPSYT